MPAEPSTNNTPSRETSTVDDRERTLSPPPEIKSEDTADEPETAAPAIFQNSPSRPLYHLEGGVYEAAAFEIIVNFMYNQPPVAPKNRAECRTQLRAYVLALNYKIIPLQDALIDCVRQYHRHYNVSFENLTWLIHRLGEGPEVPVVPMMRYIINQIAFEVCSQSYDEFARENPIFETFLSEGDRPIRAALVHAISDISSHVLSKATETDRARLDPAIGPNRWLMRDWVDPQHEPTAAVPETIEVDE